MMFLYVIMVSVLSDGSAKVVSDFRECADFFVNGIPPTILHGHQYKQICQTFKNKVYYTTLYDTNNKIPVYSAYKFNKIKSRRRHEWFIEPELENPGGGKNMKPEKCFPEASEQAVSDDYKGSGYDKGHLAPVYLACSQKSADATFTLTNAAPQNPSFNRGKWKALEREIAKELTEKCLSKQYTAYIVTGVVPSEHEKISGKVNVPSHFWSAYCCLDHKTKCKISRGFIGENKNVTPKNITVKELEKSLKELYKTNFKLFTT